MQTSFLATVPLLIAFFLGGGSGAAQATPPKMARPPRMHAVVLGGIRKVPYTPPDVTRDERNEDTTMLKVRPLIVDELQREWTTGDIHEVTERTFAVRRALHINDSLPSEREAHWVWQPGPWLLVDRVTGHITALHLPDFDSAISNVVWYRDYAAYCGTGTTAKGGLYAVVTQLGSRRPSVLKQIGQWPQTNHFIPVCKPAEWQRLPMRVTLKQTGGENYVFDVVGTSALIEEADNDAAN